MLEMPTLTAGHHPWVATPAKPEADGWTVESTITRAKLAPATSH